LGDGREHGDDPARDAAKADQLYNLLETEVVPEFYRVDQNGIPRAWVARLRESRLHIMASCERSLKRLRVASRKTSNCTTTKRSGRANSLLRQAATPSLFFPIAG
jgi:glucan phosphorylase